MAFPIELTSVLSGASVSQLRRWKTLLAPEVRDNRPALYSFRDVVALRTVVRLRADASLQKIRAAFGRMPEYDLTEHLSAYQFAVHGSSIAVSTDDGWLDLVNNPGQIELRIYTLAEIYQPFTTKTGVDVVNFLHPRPHLEINARRVGGWPVLENTRIGYDVVAALVDNKTVFPADVERYYPGATVESALDAISFDGEVRAKARKSSTR